MPTEANKALVRRFMEALNDADWPSSIDHFMHPPAVEWFRREHGAFRNAFPDYHFVIDEVIAEDDKVIVRGTASGTFRNAFPVGEFKGRAPTGRKAQWCEVWMKQVADGKIADGWLIVDSAQRMTQLGLLS